MGRRSEGRKGRREDEGRGDKGEGGKRGREECKGGVNNYNC